MWPGVARNTQRLIILWARRGKKTWKHRCVLDRDETRRVQKQQYRQPAPALLHQLTRPSSPPVTYAPAVPCAGGFGLQETDQTSPWSCTVDTAARAPISHTFVVLSAEPDTARRPSGEMSVLRTQDECPVNVATAPEPAFPEGEVRTSCRISRLSSEADSSSW